ncbi:MAG: hypothetical protein EA356_06010 [Geminicoccaceae bacterium]|nr:MAG: hypothetical protein EA356_06010 [Geminicoccaceae bacterium]
MPSSGKPCQPDPRDGRWIARAVGDEATPTPGFLAPTAHAAPGVVALEALRVDVFGKDALHAISGEVCLQRCRREEFRVERVAVTALGPDRVRLFGIGVTNARRTRYVVAFETDGSGQQGRLWLQRIGLHPKLGATQAASDAPLDVGPLQVMRCARDDDPAFRRLHLACRVDPALEGAPHLDAVLDAFACRDALRACLANLPHTPQEPIHATVERAWAEAGIAISTAASLARRAGGAGERLADVARSLQTEDGADRAALQELLAWSPRDLDAVLQEAMIEAGGDDPARWAAALLLVPRFAERPAVIGTMFGTATQPRRGSALFVEPAGSEAWTAGDRTRAVAFSAVHEIGHLLNLLHCFEADQTEHRRQPGRPEAASFMNYPNRFPFGQAVSPPAEAVCRDLFWQHFEGQFDDEELRHLRHGWAPFVRPGGAIEPLMSTDWRPSADHPGLDEAAAGAFDVEGLVEVAADLLDLLAQTPAEPDTASGALTLGLHLPPFVRLGEPVLGWLELHNGSTIAELVPAELDPASGLVRVAFADSGGRVVRFEPARCDCGAGLTFLAPGERRTQALQLGFGRTCYLTEPGRYRITATCGDRLAAVHELIVEPPTPGEARLADRLFGDERLGLALLGEAATPPLADALDAGLADHALRSPALHLALTCRRLEAALLAGLGAVEVERRFEALVRAVADDALHASGRWRWRQRIRLLHEAALGMLRAEHLAPALTARLADRAARTSLHHLAGRPPELGTARTAWAIRRAARALAPHAVTDEPFHHG